jgi:hypothetical protein
MAKQTSRPIPAVPAGKTPTKQPTSQAQNNTSRVSPAVARARHGAAAAQGHGSGGGSNK